MSKGIEKAAGANSQSPYRHLDPAPIAALNLLAFENNLSVISTVLKNAKQIIFIGIGTSGHLGKYGARYFSNLGKFSQYIEYPYYPIESDIDGTIVIALSVRKETPEVIRLAERFKLHSCKIISITNKSSCTLAKISDCNVSYYVTETMVDNEYNITTQVPVMYLIKTLGRMFSYNIFKHIAFRARLCYNISLDTVRRVSRRYFKIS